LEGNLWPAQANNSGDLISKIIRRKWTEGVAQVVEVLLFKYKFKPSPTKKTKKLIR
jgi:hypothetical protein